MSMPRWMHHVYAFCFAYFWLPCPRCGRYFGGHERGGGSEMTGWSSGMVTCPRCPYDRMDGHFLNGPEADVEWIKNQHPPILIRMVEP